MIHSQDFRMPIRVNMTSLDYLTLFHEYQGAYDGYPYFDSIGRLVCSMPIAHCRCKTWKHRTLSELQEGGPDAS